MTRYLRLLLATLLVALAAGCSQPLPADKRDYAGDWRAKDMVLLITDDGNVVYHRKRDNSTTNVNAPIKSFDGASFIVGVGPLSTRFEVSVPPHKDGNVWKMTVDGVELVRAPSGKGDDRSA
jgi:hypothetical protein